MSSQGHSIWRDWVLRGWKRRGGLYWGLAPASWIFSLVVGARALAFRCGLLRIHQVGVPVISVGNLTVGGTGKTPFSLWLTHRLDASGWCPALISRGYGGVLKRRVLTVGDGARALWEVSEIGDEAVLLAERAGVPVVCGADRVAAARTAIAEHHVEVLVLDDGFQHRRLGRQVDIALVDGRAGFGNGALLPAGPLREPISALRRADAVVVTKTSEMGAIGEQIQRIAPGVPVFPAAFAPVAAIYAEEGVTIERPLGGIVGRRIVTVSAIADPLSFYELLGELEVQPIDVLEYPDHHDFDQADWQQISKVAHAADLIVCTEKDLVKLRRFPFARGRLVALRLGLRLKPEDEEGLLRVIAERAGLIPA